MIRTNKKVYVLTCKYTNEATDNFEPVAASLDRNVLTEVMNEEYERTRQSMLIQKETLIMTDDHIHTYNDDYSYDWRIEEKDAILDDNATSVFVVTSIYYLTAEGHKLIGVEEDYETAYECMIADLYDDKKSMDISTECVKKSAYRTAVEVDGDGNDITITTSITRCRLLKAGDITNLRAVDLINKDYEDAKKFIYDKGVQDYDYYDLWLAEEIKEFATREVYAEDREGTEKVKTLIKQCHKNNDNFIAVFRERFKDDGADLGLFDEFSEVVDYEYDQVIKEENK